MLETLIPTEKPVKWCPVCDREFPSGKRCICGNDLVTAPSKAKLRQLRAEAKAKVDAVPLDWKSAGIDAGFLVGKWLFVAVLVLAIGAVAISFVFSFPKTTALILIIAGLWAYVTWDLKNKSERRAKIKEIVKKDHHDMGEHLA